MTHYYKGSLFLLLIKIYSPLPHVTEVGQMHEEKCVHKLPDKIHQLAILGTTDVEDFDQKAVLGLVYQPGVAGGIVFLLHLLCTR